jgi:hypothetical protein
MKSILNSVILVVSLMVFFSCEMNPKEKMDTIGFDGRQLQINAKDYLIKGICYHPVPRGSDDRSWKTLDQDLAIMQEAGVNTIRVYAPIEEKWVLDKLDAAEMKVVIGFGYNQNGYYDILSGSFIDYINKYKGHNAILFWEFGNEYNYHPNWFDGDMKNWYTAMNDAAIKAKQADPNRPITTAHGDLPDSLALAMSPDIDIWGMNVYRWDDPSDLFGQWATY